MEAATPSIALLSRSSTAGGGASTGHTTEDADGNSDNTAITTRFTTGTKNSSASQGLRPASAARRIVMLTPIHRNGRARSPEVGASQAGPLRNNSARALHRGLK